MVRFSYGRYYKMQGTGLAETANPVGLAGQTFDWTDTNTRRNSANQRMDQRHSQVGAFGGIEHAHQFQDEPAVLASSSASATSSRCGAI